MWRNTYMRLECCTEFLQKPKLLVRTTICNYHTLNLAFLYILNRTKSLYYKINTTICIWNFTQYFGKNWSNRLFLPPRFSLSIVLWTSVLDNKQKIRTNTTIEIHKQVPRIQNTTVLRQRSKKEEREGGKITTRLTEFTWIPFMYFTFSLKEA